MLAGLLAGSVALGAGCTRAEAEPRPQDLLQQQQQQDEDTTQDDVLNEPGTGGSVGPGDTGDTGDTGGTGTDEDFLDEPGTGGAGGTGQDDVRDEDEGVLQPGVNDEGLDHNEGQVDEDTVSPPNVRPQTQPRD
ncbi:hypothetical protein [Archangium gephyra]|nr:hypothetical protein [Archangium gephyra]AKI99749.1 Hypothetical protein AA314_01376 [Archangium gephyra]